MKRLETIDFGELGGPVYAGRPKGEAARKQLNLNVVDKQPGQVHVRIPDQTYSLNSSFFLGLFGPSVVYFGSREKFFGKYDFEGPGIFIEEVEAGVSRALTEVRPL